MKKNHERFSVEQNAFIDSGDGKLTFPNGLTIKDDSEHRNGRKYDLDTLDLSEFDSAVTVDHDSSVEKIVAKATGLKRIGNRVVVESLQYAINESPLAKLVYNLTKSGYSREFSTETYGPLPDENDVLHDAKLLRFSQVVNRNNVSAYINSIDESIKDTLELEEIKEVFGEIKQNNKETDEMKFVTVKKRS